MTARYQVDKEQDWPLTATSGRPGGPSSYRASLGHLCVREPCLLMPLLNLSIARAISSILDAWLEHYSEDFHQPPEFPWLTKLLAYTRLNIPGSDMEQHAQRLLTQFRHLKPTEPETGGKENWGWLRWDRVGHTDQTSMELAGSSE